MAFGSIMSQKPNVYTDDEVLTDETKAIYGLGPEAVPDDVFIILGIGAGKYGYGITVTYPDGTPAANLPVTGVTDRLGQPITTNDKGYFLAVSTEKSITFSIVSPYFDVNNLSNQVVNFESIVTKKKIAFAEKTYTNYILIRSSQTIQFFKDRMVDFTAVGGGGGSLGWSHGTSYGAGSAGGGGGYVATVLNSLIKKGEKIQLNIGAGGQILSPSKAGKYGGGQGGYTQVIALKENTPIVTANGGFGGNGYINQRGDSDYEHEIYSGGAGNGAGGSRRDPGADQRGLANNGTNATGFIFNEQSLGLAGGGGGGAGAVRSDSTGSAVWIVTQGGKPFGAKGAAYKDSWNIEVYAPTGPGGGAGGSLGDANKSGLQPSGASGGVYIRWK